MQLDSTRATQRGPSPSAMKRDHPKAGRLQRPRGLNSRQCLRKAHQDDWRNGPGVPCAFTSALSIG